MPHKTVTVSPSRDSKAQRVFCPSDGVMKTAAVESHMQRRTFVTTVAAALTATTAGCVASTDGDNPGTGTDPTDSPTGEGSETGEGSPSPTPTPTPPSIVSSSLEPREGCEKPDDASIAAESNVVTVEGCIVGKDGCQAPALADATYDAEADELTVTVTTKSRTDADACTQVLVDLGYTATVEFEGGLPGTTVVVHRGAQTDGEVARAKTNTT